MSSVENETDENDFDYGFDETDENNNDFDERETFENDEHVEETLKHIVETKERLERGKPLKFRPLELNEVLEESPCPSLRKGFVPKAKNISSAIFDSPDKLFDTVYGQFPDLLIDRTNINYKLKFPRGKNITKDEIKRYFGMKLFEANHWNHKGKARKWWKRNIDVPSYYENSDLRFLSLNRFFIINKFLDTGENVYILDGNIQKLDINKKLDPVYDYFQGRSSLYKSLPDDANLAVDESLKKGTSRRDPTKRFNPSKP